MYPVDKPFTNDGFQMEESINRGVPPANPNWRGERRAWYSRYHICQSFTMHSRTLQRQLVRAISQYLIRSVVLARLGDGNNYSHLPRGRKDMTKPNRIALYNTRRVERQAGGRCFSMS